MNDVLSNAGAGLRNMRRLLSVTAILALSLVAVSAGSASAATRAPLNFTVTGTATQTSSTTFTLAGTGNASGLGSVSYSGNVVITGSTAGGGLIDTVTETLTAAGGSIQILCHETATPLGQSGDLRGVDSWVVTGGTGAYVNARGSGSGSTVIHNLSTFTKTENGLLAS